MPKRKRVRRVSAANRNRKMKAVLSSALTFAVAFFFVNATATDAVTVGNELICGLPEHTHTEECHERQLTCEHIEIAHIDDCCDEHALTANEPEEHTHDDGCYTDALACALEEHTHATECYDDGSSEENGPDEEPDDTTDPDGNDPDEEGSEQPEEILYNFRQLLTMQAEVTLPVKIHINDIDNFEETTHQLTAGLIADEAPPEMDYSSYFSKAVVRINGGETEIEYAGVVNGKTYFSLPENPDVGILLTEGQEIDLYYIQTYEITYEYDSSMGSVGNSQTVVTASQSFAFHASPNMHYRVSSVIAEKPDGTKTTITLDAHNDAIIRIESDLTIYVTFEPISTYSISAGAMSNGYICDSCSNEANGNNFALSAIPAGEDATVAIWSTPSEGVILTPTKNWRLNMLSINGEDVKVPSGFQKDDTATTALSSGSIVTVSCINTGDYNRGDGKDPNFHGNPYGDLANGRYQWRYDITITNVQENMVISANVKQENYKEIIIKGLRGIEATGASVEKAALFVFEYYYSYTLRETNDNVYETFYGQGNSSNGSYNSYVYRVYPGYNPWTVSVEGVNTGVRISPDWSDCNEVYTVDDIVSAQTSKHRDWSDFSNSCAQGGHIYAFAFKESENNNQWVYLNATPYDYTMKLDLNGGTLSPPSSYAVDGNGNLVYGTSYNVEYAEDYYLPNEVPTREGYLFTGWKLANFTNIYGSNQRFPVTVDSSAIAYANGDEEDDYGMFFTFEAQWVSNQLDAEETDVYVTYYVMDSSGEYKLVDTETGTYTGTVGSGAVYKGAVWVPTAGTGHEYRLNMELSGRHVLELWARTAQGYEENNTIAYYYDYTTSYTIHCYKADTQYISVAEDFVFFGLVVGTEVTIYPKYVAGYTCTEVSQTNELKQDSEFIFWYVPISYTLRFNPNGGVGTMTDKELSYDEEYLLPENGFTRDGYQLAGWSTNPNGGVEYLPEAPVSRLGSVSGDIYTLYAVWTERIDVTVPLWVCMYAYSGDGVVVAPDNYGLYNHSLIDVQIEKLSVSNAWTLVSDSDISGGKVLRAGEVYLRLKDVTLSSGEIDLPLTRNWRIAAGVPEDGGTFLEVPIRAYVAAGSQNEPGEYPVVNVTYTIGRAN